MHLYIDPAHHGGVVIASFKKLLREGAGVKPCEFAEPKSYGRAHCSDDRKSTMRLFQPRVLADLTTAQNALDSEVVAALRGAVVQEMMSGTRH